MEPNSNTPAPSANGPTMPNIAAPTPPGAIPAPVVPPPAPPPSAGPQVTQTGTSSKKPMMMALIIVLVIAILGVGGYFAYQMLGSPKQAEDKMEKVKDTTSQDLDNLNKEAEGVEITDPDKDLMEIDADINALDASASPSASTSQVDR